VTQVDGERLRQETIDAYMAHSAAITAYARRLTADACLAQDAVQETFLRSFVARMQGEQILNCSAWLHRVAHNYICATVRSSAVRASVALDEAGSDAVSVAPAAEGEDWEESLKRLLAPREFECLRLRTEGLDYTEIASAMSIRPGTVGTLLHRAAQKVRTSFGRKGRSE
jgi:RNA polymerase sigma-70 factor (ECF subfamily)